MQIYVLEIIEELMEAGQNAENKRVFLVEDSNKDG